MNAFHSFYGQWLTIDIVQQARINESFVTEADVIQEEVPVFYQIPSDDLYYGLGEFVPDLSRNPTEYNPTEHRISSSSFLAPPASC